MTSLYDTSKFFCWDPSRELFTLPWVGYSIAWYGFFFSLGFVFAYFMALKIFKRFFSSENLALKLVDSLLWYVVLGTILGARLGHVFFYSWPLYQNDLLSIFKVWEGGLASHGGAVGVFIGLFLFLKKRKEDFPALTILVLMDALVIPTAFVGGCIRIGNFFNQEIVGTITTAPWAVVFGHPANGGPSLPRHPVQIYESFFYFFVFLLLYILWKNDKYRISTGVFSGLFFVLVFAFRFLVEFFKEPQSVFFSKSSFLLMGQYLSIPFIALGCLLLYKREKYLK